MLAVHNDWRTFYTCTHTQCTISRIQFFFFLFICSNYINYIFMYFFSALFPSNTAVAPVSCRTRSFYFQTETIQTIIQHRCRMMLSVLGVMPQKYNTSTIHVQHASSQRLKNEKKQFSKMYYSTINFGDIRESKNTHPNNICESSDYRLL